MPQAGYQVIVKVWLHCKYRVTILYMHCIPYIHQQLQAVCSYLSFALYIVFGHINCIIIKCQPNTERAVVRLGALFLRVA